MCGIAGASWTERGEALSKRTLLRMTDVLAHRGPDESGTYHSLAADESEPRHNGKPGAALGHRAFRNRILTFNPKDMKITIR